MPKVKEDKDRPGLFLFNCPGCGCFHFINTNPEYGGVWEFNNDLEKPTAKPSLLVNKSIPAKRCHSFVTNGKIQFLDDSYHELKNQTVEIPEFE